MRFLRVLPLTLICLAGCGTPSLVGKWNMSGGSTPPGSKLVAEFMASTFTVNAEVEQAGSNVKFAFSGYYTFDGKKLKMTGQYLNLDESTLPAAAKGMIPLIKSSLEKALLTTSEGDAKLEGDTMTFTTNGKPTTFTRIK
jgi:hypothetical protein